MESKALIIKQIDALTNPKLDTFTNFCTVLSHLKDALGLFWIGIYWAKEKELLLGPFQGLPACTEIKYGKGVCGTAASEKTIQIVDDVTTLENYIACHVETMSEVVIPGIKHGTVKFVLDADSTEKKYFSKEKIEILREATQKMVELL